MNTKLIVRIICIVLAVLMALSLLMSVIPVVARADELDDLLASINAEKEEATRKRVNAQNKVQELKNEQAAVIEEKIALEERNSAAAEEITLIQQQIELVNAEIELYDKKISDKEAEVDSARKSEEHQMEMYRTRIRAMEENGEYNILALILNSEDFSSLLAAIDDYGDVMNSDKILFEQLQAARQEHERLKAELVEYRAECEQKKADFQVVRAELVAQKLDLEQQIEEAKAIIEEYEEKIAQAEEEQRAMEAAEAAASAMATNFMANYYAQKAAQQAAQQQQQQQQQNPGGGDSGETGGGDFGSGDTGGGDFGGGNPEPSGTGTYVWPFPGHMIITSVFGYRPSTGSYHTGVDIDGFQSMGSPIVAADSGTVIKAEYYGGYGNCIIIDHGSGMSTLYAHLSSMNVSVGSVVAQGSTIGGVGNTGTCYGPDGVHLHFEVMVNGSQVDPLGYIGHYGYSLY